MIGQIKTQTLSSTGDSNTTRKGITKGTKRVRELLIRDEVRQKREEFMLEQAREIAAKEGLHTLTLPRLAERSGYSKPTIYKYFPTQEDLIVAMAAQSTAIRVSYYERAITFQGRPREKLYGLALLNFGPLHFYLREVLDVHINRLNQKASPVRQKELFENENRIAEIMAGIIREAVEISDLTLPENTDEYQILFTLNSTILGSYVIRESDSQAYKKWFDRKRIWPGDVGRIFLDGIGWRPLSSEWDYSASRKRFLMEVFPELLTDEGAAEKSTV
ncbi:MAG: TetR/AcrR family transcriptional regulator [Deltaproteobacteria bacterium]|nr:TetR/AcrR family transcriptional regulator [Deltaproteobacteria bacterium]